MFRYPLLILLSVGFTGLAQEKKPIFLKDFKPFQFTHKELKTLSDSLPVVLASHGFTLVTPDSLNLDMGRKESQNTFPVFQQFTLQRTFQDGQSWLIASILNSDDTSPVHQSKTPFVDRADWLHAPLLTALFKSLIPKSSKPHAIREKRSITIDCKSSPAMLYLNGEYQGSQFPLTISDLATDEYHFYIRSENKIISEYLSIDMASPETLHFNPSPRILIIDSDPEGAMVSLDGQEIGKTPLKRTLPLSVINSQISIYLQDYVREILNLDLSEHPLKPITIDLSKGAALQVITNPAGAVMLVNGDSVGVTPIWYRGIPYGKVALTLRFPGLEDYHQTLEMNPGLPYKKLEIDINNYESHLIISPLPRETRLKVDGKTILGALDTLVAIQPGKHRLEFISPGYHKYQRTIDVNNNHSLPLEIKMKPVNYPLSIALSTLYPGAGQFYSKRYPKAYLMGGGAFLSLVALSASLNTIDETESKIEDIERTLASNITPASRFNLISALDDQLAELSDQKATRNLLYFLNGAVWAYSIIDAITQFPPHRQKKFAFSGRADHLRLSIRF